jgi:hypothetical protein
MFDTFPEFSQNPFETWQAANYRFSKDSGAIPGNVSTNRKKGVKIQKRRAQSLPIFESFW